MGCLNSKNTAEKNPSFSNNSLAALNRGEELTPAKKVSASKPTAAAAGKSSSPPKGKGSIMQVDQFKVHYTDLIGESKENINKVYNIIMPPLGKGTFGEVRKAIHKETGLIRAVKMILKSSTSEEEKKKLLNEVQILKHLDHPNIIKIYEFFQDDKYFYIVSELCTGGELFDKIVEVKSFNENQAADIMSQLLSAVTYCRSKKIVHRDLKPENLLLESKKEGSPLKVIDFGTSREFDPKIKMNQKFGTMLYMAPEVLKGTYDQKCDIWSCGVILYILLCGYPPFNSRNEKEIVEKIKTGVFDFPDDEWKFVSEEAKTFIKRLLKVDPKERLTGEQAIQDPWMKKRNKSGEIDKPLAIKALGNLKSFRADRKLQQATWVFLVSYIASKDEKNELMNTFKALDLNGDGQLSKQELLLGYKKIMGEAEAEKEVENIMSTVDTNNSGFIDYSEFVTASINRQKLLSKERLEMAFKMFDKDGSGYITTTELKAMFGGGENAVDDEVWNGIIKEVDANGDGEISLAEFKEMMMKLHGGNN